jgi:hypothetical protein
VASDGLGYHAQLGLQHRPTLRLIYLAPAIDKGLIAMTVRDKPDSRLQKYRLTDRGRSMLGG